MADGRGIHLVKPRNVTSVAERPLADAWNGLPPTGGMRVESPFQGVFVFTSTCSEGGGSLEERNVSTCTELLSCPYCKKPSEQKHDSGGHETEILHNRIMDSIQGESKNEWAERDNYRSDA